MPPGPRSRLNSTGTVVQVQSARLKLADAILSVAKEDSQDAEELKTAALAIMAREYLLY